MVVDTSITPGSATAAATRCSCATARGTQKPPWLRPSTAILAGSMSGLSGQVVDQRGEDGFPVRPEREVLADQRERSGRGRRR